METQEAAKMPYRDQSSCERHVGGVEIKTAASKTEKLIKINLKARDVFLWLLRKSHDAANRLTFGKASEPSKKKKGLILQIKAACSGVKVQCPCGGFGVSLRFRVMI